MFNDLQEADGAKAIHGLVLVETWTKGMNQQDLDERIVDLRRCINASPRVVTPDVKQAAEVAKTVLTAVVNSNDGATVLVGGFQVSKAGHAAQVLAMVAHLVRS